MSGQDGMRGGGAHVCASSGGKYVKPSSFSVCTSSATSTRSSPSSTYTKRSTPGSGAAEEAFAPGRALSQPPRDGPPPLARTHVDQRHREVRARRLGRDEHRARRVAPPKQGRKHAALGRDKRVVARVHAAREAGQVCGRAQSSEAAGLSAWTRRRTRQVQRLRLSARAAAILPGALGRCKRRRLVSCANERSCEGANLLTLASRRGCRRAAGELPLCTSSLSAARCINYIDFRWVVTMLARATHGGTR